MSRSSNRPGGSVDHSSASVAETFAKLLLTAAPVVALLILLLVHRWMSA